VSSRESGDPEPYARSGLNLLDARFRGQGETGDMASLCVRAVPSERIRLWPAPPRRERATPPVYTGDIFFERRSRRKARRITREASCTMSKSAVARWYHGPPQRDAAGMTEDGRSCLSNSVPAPPPFALAAPAITQYIARRRSVAQPGRALLSGGRGRRFKSSHSDQSSSQLARSASWLLLSPAPRSAGARRDCGIFPRGWPAASHPDRNRRRSTPGVG
jgi:hypothetical protein